MTVIAWLLFAILLLIALLHAYWGAGGTWPGRDAASCARTVTGFRGRHEMPSPAACFAVAACLLVAAIWPLALTGHIRVPLASILLALGATALGLVFLGRGLAGFTAFWRRLTPEEPFASLDRRLYSPLCILLGAGFIFLSIRGYRS